MLNENFRRPILGADTFIPSIKVFALWGIRMFCQDIWWLSLLKKKKPDKHNALFSSTTLNECFTGVRTRPDNSGIFRFYAHVTYMDQFIQLKVSTASAPPDGSTVKNMYFIKILLQWLNIYIYMRCFDHWTHYSQDMLVSCGISLQAWSHDCKNILIQVGVFL